MATICPAATWAPPCAPPGRRRGAIQRSFPNARSPWVLGESEAARARAIPAGEARRMRWGTRTRRAAAAGPPAVVPGAASCAPPRAPPLRDCLSYSRRRPTVAMRRPRPRTAPTNDARANAPACEAGASPKRGWAPIGARVSARAPNPPPRASDKPVRGDDVPLPRRLRRQCRRCAASWRPSPPRSTGARRPALPLRRPALPLRRPPCAARSSWCAPWGAATAQPLRSRQPRGCGYGTAALARGVLCFSGSSTGSRASTCIAVCSLRADGATTAVQELALAAFPLGVRADRCAAVALSWCRASSREK